MVMAASTTAETIVSTGSWTSLGPAVSYVALAVTFDANDYDTTRFVYIEDYVDTTYLLTPTDFVRTLIEA